MTPRPPTPTLFPYTTLFRSSLRLRQRAARGGRPLFPRDRGLGIDRSRLEVLADDQIEEQLAYPFLPAALENASDRKSTRLNSSHGYISYAVFCLKKKNRCLP